ncbi:Similar to S.cerevisiae protein PGC1 (Phosphatidyl Glycerol phospholipase C) [Malassezia sympodialis ATCC 42132]|uniref:Similar to S.cerevisiae protein PGC1 (Phosphatidyl Glycerol phospholipase C) n=1 Tax=Malassezia sympodialis (strain ATCC 42132) TaxID=1230383 RepID=A0A1M8A337_MALS4|nr:Similar to S.cerevisiae protein PGC1 (Phosphatidyl Glycerol phospholipase C) [Malassezia sympodialis ATCC 42132]
MSTPGLNIPHCWGHRGASAEFPENTLRSFEQAIKDGSEGIESDVHITADDVIVMFHDTTLDRTTNGKGLITARNYFGADGLEHVRTLKEPVQQIPTFKELCTLLMEPENRHVSLNVDIKPNNDPERLFRIMGEVVHQFPNYENDLAPRLILGLWHPKFIQPAKHHVPMLRRAHIGASPADAVKYFWNDCDAFSIRFPSLVGAEGQAFLRKAREANKDVMVWTVNRKDEMVEAARYGVKAILTDYTADLHKLRDEMKVDFDAVHRQNVSPWFSWASLRYYAPAVYTYQRACRFEVERHAGESFDGARLA